MTDDVPTKAQHKALALIRDNPGRVIAWLRGEKDFLTIHGNTENALVDLKWIKASEPIETRTRMVGREAATYEVRVWKLTGRGEEALIEGDRVHIQPGPDEPRLAKLKELEVPFQVCVYGDGKGTEMNPTRGSGVMVTIEHLRKRGEAAIEGVTADGHTVRFGLGQSLIRVIPGAPRR